MGTRVRIRAVSAAEAERLQEGHGGWSSSMAALLGTEGRVERAWSDGGQRALLVALETLTLVLTFRTSFFPF